HPVYSTTISTLRDPTILPIDQNTARYFNRVAVDTQYGGMADSDAEGARLASLLKDRTRLMMGNHGVLIVAETVGEAFDDMYTIERACQILVTAYSTGRELSVLSDDVAERTARDWEKIRDFSIRHFEEMKLILDREEPDYAE
ncbi:MAG: class II aldolase/adducin family protein, partial [Gluconobacter sp.]